MTAFRKPDFGTRLESRALSADELVAMHGFKQDAQAMIRTLGRGFPACPETVLAQRKIQEAVFWATFALTGAPVDADDAPRETVTFRKTAAVGKSEFGPVIPQAALTALPVTTALSELLAEARDWQAVLAGERPSLDAAILQADDALERHWRGDIAEADLPLNAVTLRGDTARLLTEMDAAFNNPDIDLFDFADDVATMLERFGGTPAGDADEGGSS